MRTSDQSNGGRDVAWRNAGTGSFATRSCWLCGKHKIAIGGKPMGSHKSWHCSQCVEIRQQKEKA